MSIEELWQQVKAVSRYPKDPLEVSAVLESIGVTDEVSKGTYACADVFELGGLVFDHFSRDPLNLVTPQDHPDDLGWPRLLWAFVRYYIRGVMFVMPMLVSILSVLGLGLSLWAYLEFTPDIATAIAAGTMLSFIVTGGFTQALGRRGLMYLSQGEYGMVRRFVFLTLRTGVCATLLVGLAVLVLYVAFPMVPWYMVRLALLYYAFLCLIWLSIAALYMMQQEFVFTALVAVGILAVYVCYSFVGLSIIASQMIGLAMTAAGSILASTAILRAQGEHTEGSRGVTRLPRLSVLTYTLLPYFSYGVLYFGLLYADRVMAWSSSLPDPIPYPLWFRGQYELGMDWATFALVFPMGLVEWYSNRFVQGLVAYEKSVTLGRQQDLYSHYLMQYRDQLVTFCAVATAGGLGVHWALHAHGASAWMVERGLALTGVTEFVMDWAIVGYILICIGLLNCLMFMCLSNHRPALKAVGAGLVVDVLAGFILSRAVSHEYAVLGLVCGAGVFAVHSTLGARQMLRSLAYYHYTSL